MQIRRAKGNADKFSAIRHCDKIIEGKIVESGTHDQLMALGGLYKYLHDQQEGRG